jgi:hypothetical protein
MYAICRHRDVRLYQWPWIRWIQSFIEKKAFYIQNYISKYEIKLHSIYTLLNTNIFIRKLTLTVKGKDTPSKTGTFFNHQEALVGSPDGSLVYLV